MTTPYKQAVCLAAREPGCPPNEPRFLAVSRRHDNTQWGFPGGKEDPGETLLQAVVRECKEELGIDLDPTLLTPAYTGICPGKGPEDTYEVTTFVTTQQLHLKDMTPEEGLELQYQSPGQLCSEFSPFAGYNLAAFQAIEPFFQSRRAWSDTSEPEAQAPVTLNLSQMRQLEMLFGDDDDCLLVLVRGDGHSGYGVYAYYDEYPEEGATFLDPDWVPVPEDASSGSLISVEASLRFRLSCSEETVKNLEEEVRELKGLLAKERASSP